MRDKWVGLVTVLMLPTWALGKELLVNGSFEQGEKAPTGWAGSEGAQWEEGGRTGKCAVLGAAPKAGAWVTWKQEVKSFRPDTPYTFSCWVKADRRALAQVVVDGLKPHKAGVSFFYMWADAKWRPWVKQVVGDPSSNPAVSVMLLNEGGPETFYFDDVSFTVREEVDLQPVPLRKVAEVPEGREPGDLISNGRFEVGEKDSPAGWYHGDPALMARTAADKYFHDPGKDTGIYAWERTGFSGRSVSVTAPKGEGWGGWSTQTHNVKPNTKYTIEFWYRISRKGALKVFLFGKELICQDMLPLNPRHWWRYTATVDSGAASGDCNLGFVVEGDAMDKTTAWVDNVELFEGLSPIGTNVARLIHVYYDFTFVSPDVVSPVPFAFEWCFEDGKQPEEIGYVVELPKELELTGYYVGRLRHTAPWGVVWTNPDDTARLEKQDVEHEGTPYTRYVFYQKQVRDGDPKAFGKDGFVPVEVRNNWHTYGGMTALMLYVLSRNGSGELPPLYYHATWQGGQQNRQKLALRLTRIAETPRVRKMALVAGAGWWAADQNPQVVADYVRLGFSGFDALSAKDPANLGKAIAEARQKGIKYIATWANIPSYSSSDPNAKAMAPDFNRGGDNWCLEYRGPDWKKRMDDLKAKLDSGINTFLFDDASPSTCHCSNCKQLFKEFLKEKAGLDYVSPGDFLAPDWTGDKRYLDLWRDFPLYHYGLSAAAMKRDLVDYAKAKGLPADLYFGISSWLGANSPLAASSLGCFDFDSNQTYMNWSLEAFQGSPRLTGDYLRDKQNRLGKQALPLVPTISPGLGYMNPLCSLDPHDQMKYQVLEMMMAPKALGYTVYAANDFDLGDMKYAAEANAILARFEDLITDGELMPELSAQDTEQSTVRAKKLGDELLVLVSDYSTYDPVETTVSFSLPQAKSLVDVETGEVLKPTGEGAYKVMLRERRLRMLYSGPKRR